MVSDPHFVADIQRELMSMQQWKNPGLQAVINMAWALTLRAISQYSNIQGEPSSLVTTMFIETSPFVNTEGLVTVNTEELIASHICFRIIYTFV